MIIYGTKVKELVKETLFDKCQKCGSQNSIDMFVYQRYVHVFWIPFFPTGKAGYCKCSYCNQVLKQPQMTPELKESYNRLKKEARTPVWMFSGIFLLALLIGISVMEGRKSDQRNARLIAAPQGGDIFEIKTKDHQYTLLKVEKVQGDSVLIRSNLMETNKRSGLESLREKGDKGFGEELQLYRQAELKKMLDQGEIIDIERP